MMMPSIFRENLFDDFMNDPFDRMITLAQYPGFGKAEKNLLKTDIKDTENGYELDMDLPAACKMEHDAVGHYARPDVLQLVVSDR